MSANAFYAFYGIRWQCDADDEPAVTQLELRKHPLQLTAAANGLQTWWGQCADSDHYYVLVGKMLAKLGVENQSSVRIEDYALSHVVAEVRAKLQAAGFDQEPAILFEFELG